MARFTRIEVALKMKETGIIPVFFHSDAELCKQVLKACYDGGIRVFEFTNRGDNAHEVFSEINKWAIKELPELILGVGSVVDAPTAALYIQLGTNFIVSPLLNPDIAKVCNRRKIFWAPGCGSVSEIGYAEELGAEVCKIFPGSEVGGPSFVKSVKAPCPWTSLMPTGGVAPTKESLEAWFGAGVTCVGMGSQLISKSIIENKDFDRLKEQCINALNIVQKIRK